MSIFTEYEFSKCVKRYKGDRHAIKFNCRDQFLVMSFAQFTNRSGLRDIETTLDLCSQDLYRSQGKRIIKIFPFHAAFCLTRISQITRKRIISLAFAIRTATYER